MKTQTHAFFVQRKSNGTALPPLQSALHTNSTEKFNGVENERKLNEFAHHEKKMNGVEKVTVGSQKTSRFQHFTPIVFPNNAPSIPNDVTCTTNEEPGTYCSKKS